jgi:hypothetical protein
MARIHKIVGYVIDYNDNFENFESLIDYTINNSKYAGSDFIDAGSDISEEFDMEDDDDINQVDCSIAAFEKYFE